MRREKEVVKLEKQNAGGCGSEGGDGQIGGSSWLSCGLGLACASQGLLLSLYALQSVVRIRFTWLTLSSRNLGLRIESSPNNPVILHLSSSRE